MKPIKPILLLVILVFTLGCKNDKSNTNENKAIAENITADPVLIHPIQHGTLVIETKDLTIYVDPTGGKKAFNGQKKPTYVLITDIHGDHLSNSTLESLDLTNVIIISPKAVTDKIPTTLSKTIMTLKNGQSYSDDGILIEAIPMYNLREEALKFHEKGRGNGYILTIEDQRIYISGDTEDIPEMRNLKNIDKAFVCMNLPYTMTVESAAGAVLDFKPKTVYPYHYRGTNGLSDIAKFKSLIEAKNDEIEVKLLNWYKK
ncbi:MBL fold metallo-hydrolase [Winogradskyella sp. KYW1333]|jgi:L-ascorbate metabolism protein UlaG (beta-lactamase superfamily)|uniref:MBL fold metallo-hydrolase n=1 Tax=unclassified Winogradskyella TaxID=2615021 RepID=UPI000DF451FE|nr:MBL fold metallo-hydrolase [Winogradskyella sp. KYW1333]RCT54293.1 MBL fold metallo-hydrolase [Winogradskyella sp. KYW1333]